MISTESDSVIGYIKSDYKLTVCSLADMDEVWKSRLKGENVTLWCLHKNGSDDSDSDEGMTKPSQRQRLPALEEESQINNIIIVGTTWQQIYYYSIQTVGGNDVHTHKYICVYMCMW